MTKTIKRKIYKGGTQKNTSEINKQFIDLLINKHNDDFTNVSLAIYDNQLCFIYNDEMVLNISKLLGLNKLSDEEKRNICNNNYLYELEENKPVAKIELSNNETINKLIILLRNDIITQIEELNTYLLDPTHFCDEENDDDVFHDAEVSSSSEDSLFENTEQEKAIENANEKSQNDINTQYPTNNEKTITTVNNPISSEKNFLSQPQNQQGGRKHKRTQKK